MKQTMVSLSMCLLLSIPAFAAKTEMTYEQYEMELASVQQREKAAREEIAQEQAKIEALKQQLAELEQRIAAVIQEKYDILGITEADVVAAENEIASIRQELELLLGLSPEELAKRVSDIKKLEARIAALKQKPVSYLWRVRDKIRDVEALLERVKANLPNKPSQYEVRLIPERRDCLYRIAQYDFIYNDPAGWPKIYSSNKSLIDNSYDRYKQHTQDPKYTRAQDLIFPGQVLDIPR